MYRSMADIDAARKPPSRVKGRCSDRTGGLIAPCAVLVLLPLLAHSIREEVGGLRFASFGGWLKHDRSGIDTK